MSIGTDYLLHDANQAAIALASASKAIAVGDLLAAEEAVDRAQLSLDAAYFATRANLDSLDDETLGLLRERLELVECERRRVATLSRRDARAASC